MIRHHFPASFMRRGLSFKNKGSVHTTERMEKRRPLMEPVAKENQNLSPGPSVRKGIKPKTVEKTVRRMGMILWWYAFR